MDKVRIAVQYNGQWMNEGGNLKYEGGKTKGIMLSKSAAYEELHNAICRAIEINPGEVAITMKFKYKMCDAAPPIEVLDDSDVEFFIGEVSDVITRNPLCITIERKGDSTAAVLVGEEECGKNRGVKDAVQICLDSEVPDTAERAIRHEDMIGVDNNANHIFDQFGTEAAPGYTSPLPLTEASPVHCYGSSNDKKLKSEDVDLDCTVGTTSSKLLAIDGGCIDSICNSVKEVRPGDIFCNKEELQLNIRMLAAGSQFNTRVKKSTKELLVMACVEKGCKWWLRATKLVGLAAFRVRKYIPYHTCSLDALVCHRTQVTSKLIGHCIKWKYEGASQCYRPNDIVKDMKKRYGLTCNYNKAWRAREVAMMLARGSPEQSYSVLPLYCAMLERKNSGTITHIECDAHNRFKYFFLALGGSLAGFRSCIRPVIAVDGTFLTSKYKGTLFIATCMDGNNQVYPLAFGVGDSENDSAWIWFLTKLHGCIGDVPDLVFISDRNTSIATAIEHSFPGALHGICMYHLGQNMKANCKGGNVQSLFYKAAKAYRVSVFNALMSQIAGLNCKAAEYLTLAEPSRWARCEFPGRRYSIMTTNIAECLNVILKEARHLPITKLVEHIREVLQRWFWERREEATKMPTPMTRWVEAKLRQRMKKACTYHVRPIDVYKYVVMDGLLNPIVNLQNQTCDCKKFQGHQLPCAHALAASKHLHISCYNYCAVYYRTETLAEAYATSIYPVGPEDEWIWPDGIEVPVVLPLEGRKPRGRPSTIRKPSKGEHTKQSKCSRCGGIGHNRQKCRVPIPV